MKRRPVKIHRWKQIVAWILVVALLSGNMSGLAVNTAYAAGITSTGKATPSNASPSNAAKTIQVQVKQKDIETVLKKEEGERPELNEDLIPFKGTKKEAVSEMLYQELEDKILIKQVKKGKMMYLIVVDQEESGESTFNHVQLIGVNGSEKEDCDFLLQILGNNMTVTEALVTQYKVVGDNEEPEQVIETEASESTAPDSIEAETETIQKETDPSVNEVELPKQEIRKGNKLLSKSSHKVDVVASSLRLGNDTKVGGTSKDDLDTGNYLKGSTGIKEGLLNGQPDKDNTASAPIKTIKPEVADTDEVYYDILPDGEETKLTEEELNALQGIGDFANPENENILLQDNNTAFYKAHVDANGIVSLIASVTVAESIFTQAEAFWGDQVENKRRIANVMVETSYPVEEIKAGETFDITFSYAAAAIPVYTATALEKYNFYDEIRDAEILLKVPDAIIIKNCTYTSDEEGFRTYHIPVGLILQGGGGVKKFTAYIAGNGKTAIGTSYTIDLPDAVSIKGKITVDDPYDPLSNPVDYTLTDIGDEETELKPITWTLVSDDEWTVIKSLDNPDGKGIVEEITDQNGDIKKAVKFEYTIDVGLSKNGIQGSDANYFDKGRAAFDQYEITDQLTFENDSDVKPIKVTMKSGDKDLGVVWNSSIITTNYYEQQGNHDVTSLKYEVDDGAPAFTSYSITAYYPYEAFELNYWDERVDDGETYKVNNTAQMRYRLYGNEDSELSISSADGSYQYTKGYQKLKIKKNLLIPVFGNDYKWDKIPYNSEIIDKYPGYVEFTIDRKQDDGSFEPYHNAKVKSESGFTDAGRLVINPFSDEFDDGLSVQGEDGFIEIYVEPGQYLITEIHVPNDTLFGPDAAKDSYVLKVDAREQDAEALFDNRVVNKGGIEFTKKGQIYENNQLVEKPVPVEGAVYGIYTDTSQEPIMTAVSGMDGKVTFYPLNAGNYFIKEISSPEGFLVDPKEYPVEVIGNRMTGIDNDQNVIINAANRSVITVTKEVKDYDTDEYVKITSDLNKYEKVFTIQIYNETTNSWETYTPGGTLIGLETTGEHAGTFSFTLPILKAHGDQMISARYRILETVPAGYTAETIDGIQEFNPDDGIQGVVTSREFTLTSGQKENIVIRDMPQGTLALNKQAVEYKLQEDGTYGLEYRGSNNKFYLFKKIGDSYEMIPNTKSNPFYQTTELNSGITKQNLDIQDENGQPVEYFWYEADQESYVQLDAYSKPYEDGVGSTDKRLLTGQTININGTKITNASLIGPFTLKLGTEPTAYVYNVIQKVPYWVTKLDIDTKQEIVWKTNKPEDKFEFTFYDQEGHVYAVAYNDRKPVMLQTGVSYKVVETRQPANYTGFEGGSVDENGVHYLTVDLTNYDLIGLESSNINRSTELSVTFENRLHKQLKIIQELVRYIRPSNKFYPYEEYSETTDVKFNVYTMPEEGVFELATSTQFNAGSNYWVSSGTYYVEEVKLLDGYADPKFYLEPGNHLGEELSYYYDKEGNHLYYGPIVISDDSEEIVSYKVTNKENKGSIQAVNYNTLLADPNDETIGTMSGGRFEFYRKKNESGGIENENLQYVRVMQVTNPNGLIILTQEGGYPVYYENGDKITYVLKQTIEPEGYTHDDNVYVFQLDVGELLTHMPDGNIIGYYNEPYQKFTVNKYWYSSWDSNFHIIKNELMGVELALYEQLPGENVARLKATAVTAKDGSVVFDQNYKLERGNTYYVVEVYEDSVYSMPDGKEPLVKEGDPPEELSVESDGVTLSGNYNYTKFLPLSKTEEDDRNSEILNEKAWVQFHLIKTANKEVNAEKTDIYTEEVQIKGETYYAKDIDTEKVNGADFNLYMSDLNEDHILDEKQMGEFIRTYQTGTKLNSDGKQIMGEFSTSILSPGKVYWLVEDYAGYGFVKGDNQKIIALAPDDGQDGDTYHYNKENVELHLYQKNATTTVDAVNYKWSTGSIPDLEYLSYLKLNKWLKDEKDNETIYTPLGGVTFELRIGDHVISTLETGLDNNFNSGSETVVTGQAISKLLEFSKIVEQLTEDEIQQYVDMENHIITFKLHEVKAPEKINMFKDPKTVKVKFVQKRYNPVVNEDYYYTEGKDESNRLVNNPIKQYAVKVNIWGYRPEVSMFRDDKLTDEILENIEWLQPSALSGVTLDLYMYNTETNEFEPYLYDGLTSTIVTDSTGSFVFKNGLPLGRYGLVQKNLGLNNYLYYYNLYSKGTSEGEKTYFKEFVVEGAPSIVNIYNPELPALEIVKTVIDGSSANFDNLIFTLVDETGEETSRTISGSTQSLALFDHMLPGSYTLKESGETIGVTTKYADIYNNTALNLGYERKDDNGIYLARVDGGMPYKTKITVKNPRTGSLLLSKTDEAEPDRKLAGAKFKLQYAEFKDEDFDWSNGTPIIKYPNGPVTEQNPELLAMVQNLEWGVESEETDPTNNQGELRLDYLNPGWYRIIETTAPEGYALSENVHYVALTTDMAGAYVELTKDVPFTDKKNVEYLGITKALSYGSIEHEDNEVPGTVGFELYLGTAGEDGISVELVGQTEIDGNEFIDGYGAAYVRFTNVRQLTEEEKQQNKHYYLKEVVDQDHKEYWLLKEAYQGNQVLPIYDGYVELPGFDSSKPVEVKLQNTYAKADVELKKVDLVRPEKRLAGAEFAIYEAVDEQKAPIGEPLKAEFKDHGDGSYSLKGIILPKAEEATYYIFETKAPSGYAQLDEPVEIRLSPGMNVKPGDLYPQLIVPNERGIAVSLIKYADIWDNIIDPEEGIQTSDVVFDLYSCTAGHENNPDTVWKLERSASTPVSPITGRIDWEGLSAVDKTYAVYEHEITKEPYENYTLDSVYFGSIPMESVTAKVNEDGATKKLFILSEMEAGNTYTYQAYDKPSVKITIRKADLRSKNAKPTAVFEIRDMQGNVVKDNLVTKPVPGEPYSQINVQLKDGSYVIVEKKAGDGYSLIPDDSRVVTSRIITVPDDSNVYTFFNMMYKPELSLQKSIKDDTPLNNLWWYEDQIIEYVISPKLTSDSALTKFVVQDEGLVMLNEQGKALNKPGEENMYTKDGKYAFTKISLPVPTQNSYILNSEGTVVAPGNVSAKVTVTYFGGETDEYTGVITDHAVNGLWTIDLGTDRKVKSFAVEYYDEMIQNATSGKYLLGQGFNPGDISVEAHVYQQKAGESIEAYEEVARIRNYSSVDGNYAFYDKEGNYDEKALADRVYTDIKVLKPEIPTIEIDMSVENQTNPWTSDGDNRVEVNDVLQYSMSLNNVSADTIKTPMVNPVFLNQLPKGLEPDLNSIKIYAEGTAVSFSQDEIAVKQGNDGYPYLYIPGEGYLNSGEKIKVTFKAEVQTSIIKNGSEIRGTMYATSTDKKQPFAGNYGGATFKVQNLNHESWPDVIYNDAFESVVQEFSLPEKNGYAHTYSILSFNTDSSVILLKEGRGDLDELAGSGFVSGKNSAKVSPDGYITYNLTTKNTSRGVDITRLRIADVLPFVSEKEDVDGGNRGSEWMLKFADPDSISVSVIRAGEDAGTPVEGSNIYYLPAGGEFIKADTMNGPGEYTDLIEKGWLSELPEGTTAGAIIIDTGDQVTIGSGDELVVEFRAKVQDYNLYESLEDIAFKYSVNNFSLKYSYKETGSDTSVNFFRTLTSNPVQAVLVPERVGFGGKIWVDANGNGIQDDEFVNTLDDLQKLIQDDYFNVRLLSEGEESGPTRTIKGTIPDNPPDVNTVKPAGIFSQDGEYLFTGLLPGQPNSENNLYHAAADDDDHNVIRNRLNKNNLKGTKPETHKVVITTKEESKNIIPGMILEKSPTTMMRDDNGAIVSNGEGGKSRKPNEVPETEILDSNFISKQGSYETETFFLWANSKTWDSTKDFGYIPYRDVEILKKGQNGEALKDVSFTIYGPFEQTSDVRPDQSKKIGTYKTDAEGKLTGIPKLLYYMNYLITEDQPADNYVLAGASANLDPYQGSDITGWILPKEIVNVQIMNQYETGNLEFKKVDQRTGDYLADAEFKITRAAEQGAYDNTSGGLELFAQEITNKTAQEQAEIGIKEARYEDGALYFMTTGLKNVILQGIPNGIYELEETKVPQGYDDTYGHLIYKFTVDGDQYVKLENAVDNVIENIRSLSKLSWQKVDTVGNKLEGVEFTIQGPGQYTNALGVDIFMPDDSSGTKTLVTDTEGKIFVNVNYGDYKITETTPNGYKDNDAFYIRISEDGSVILSPGQKDRPYIKFEAGAEVNFKVVNTPKSGILEVQMIDGECTGVNLAGAVFNLTADSTVVPGAWTAFLNSDPTGNGIEILENDPEYPDALRFMVTGTFVCPSTDGMGRILNLPYGDYTLIESEAPEGYVADLTPRVFTINDSNTKVSYIRSNPLYETNGPIKNLPLELTITKVDKDYTNRHLAGAKFILRTEDGNYVKLADGSFIGFTPLEKNASRFESGSDGTVVVKRLPPGTYTLIEKQAPDQYEVNNDITPVTIYGEHKAVVVEGIRVTATAAIKKVAAENVDQVLSGAVFGIYTNKDCKGASKVAEVTTDDDGFGRTKNLPLGTYYVKEIKAPVGYKLSSAIYSVQLGSDQDEYIVNSTFNDNVVPYIVNYAIESKENRINDGKSSSMDW